MLFFLSFVVQAQFTYTTNAGGTSITITGGPGGAVNIPSSINGFTVTSIGDGAFDGFFLQPNISLTSVAIPSTVTNIGGYAFYYCTAMLEVTLAKGLIQIEDGAFYADSSLSSITIPGSVSSIGDNAFQDCTCLTNAVIMEGVTSIGNEAFLGCTNLRTVTIAGSVTNIGDGAFESCSNLNSITIAGSVGSYAFAYCTSLTNASFSNGVGRIGDYAFLGSGRLASIVIPGSVNSIGVGAFVRTSLSNVAISEGVSVIGDIAFIELSLTTVTFPPSVKSIGGQAFCQCNRLTNVTFSEGLTNIGLSAFAECPITTLTLPSSLVSAGYGSFAGCSLASLTINGGVSGDVAFENCTSLTNVTIGAGVTNLGFGMFGYCDSLTNVFFQGNVPTASGTPGDGGGTSAFYPPQICYYLPGAKGWSNTYQGVPAILWNPLIQTGNGNFGVQNNHFGFDITGTPAIPIVVEAATNLANPVWTRLTNVTLTNGLFHFSEPAQPSTPNRYYRIASP